MIGMSDLNQEWLRLFRSVGAEAFEKAKQLYGTEESREKLGRGAGGDITIRFDKELEDILIRHLKDRDNVKLISEEAGELSFGTPEVLVVADPLDGSFNAKRGIPIFAVSLALAVPEAGNTDKPSRLPDLKVGYVMNLVNGDEYWALRGEGAYKNGDRLPSSKGKDPNVYGVELSPYPELALNRLIPLLDKNSRVRCIGSLALDLCFTAEGIFGCMLDLRKEHCRILDVCAGIVILEESGGIVSDDKGQPLNDRPITIDETFDLVGAVNTDVHKWVIELLKDTKKQ